jgi:hypothetical protein
MHPTSIRLPTVDWTWNSDTLPAMPSDDLNSKQWRQFHETLYPSVNYIAHLRKRMAARKFVHTDKIYQEVIQAHCSLVDLRGK